MHAAVHLGMPNTNDLRERETQPPPAIVPWPFLESFVLRTDERTTLVPDLEEQAMLEWECELG